MQQLYVWTDTEPAKVQHAMAPVLKTGANIQIVKSLKDLPADKTVLVLGEEPRKLLANAGLIPKNRTITSMRHKLWPLQGLGRFLFSYSPGIKAVDNGKYTDFLCDARIAVRVSKTGEYEPKMGDYRWVDDFSEAIAGIKAQFKATGARVDAAFDTETVGADPYADAARFVVLQLTWQPGKSDMVYFGSMNEWLEWRDKHADQLGWLLTTPMLSMCMANGKFDCTWVQVHTGIECTNFRFDTLLVGSLLDENRSNSLNVHAKIYTDIGGYDDEFNAKIDKSRMDLVPKESMLNYAGGDTHACYDTRIAMREELLQDPRAAGFYVNILHPAARAFEQVEQCGVCVDHKAFAELKTHVETDLLQLIADARKLVPGRIFIKHEDTDKFGGINLTKSAFLKDFMFSPAGLNLKPKMFTPKPDKDGNKIPSTAMEHLMMFEGTEADPFIAIMKAYGSAKKILDTYIIGFMKHLRSDGRFHPNYFMFAGDKQEDEGGTNTGRLSVKDPAFQTIPKHGKWGKLIRQCFPAPPGYVVLESDYSQGELRVVACVAHEAMMLQTYKDGMDMHVMTAGRANGYTYAQMLQIKKENPALYDQLRQRAKAGNFGLLYGMGAEGFQIYARRNYGVHMTLQEAEEFRNAFFAAYPGLIAYHKEYKAFARQHGFVRSPLGRLRHLPLIHSLNRSVASQAERQAINSPIQGTLSDMMIWAIASWHKMGLQKQAPVFGSIHDASYTYAPEDQAEYYARRMKETMENLPYDRVGWTPQLKFIADVKAGPNMGKLEEFKFAA
jgi:DNA polymerase I-like protein with 3'-5' exonuclease and polymerase domains